MVNWNLLQRQLTSRTHCLDANPKFQFTSSQILNLPLFSQNFRRLRRQISIYLFQNICFVISQAQNFNLPHKHSLRISIYWTKISIYRLRIRLTTTIRLRNSLPTREFNLPDSDFNLPRNSIHRLRIYSGTGWFQFTQEFNLPTQISIYSGIQFTDADFNLLRISIYRLFQFTQSFNLPTELNSAVNWNVR